MCRYYRTRLNQHPTVNRDDLVQCPTCMQYYTGCFHKLAVAQHWQHVQQSLEARSTPKGSQRYKFSFFVHAELKHRMPPLFAGRPHESMPTQPSPPCCRPLVAPGAHTGSSRLPHRTLCTSGRGHPCRRPGRTGTLLCARAGRLNNGAPGASGMARAEWLCCLPHTNHSSACIHAGQSSLTCMYGHDTHTVITHQLCLQLPLRKHHPLLQQPSGDEAGKTLWEMMGSWQHSLLCKTRHTIYLSLSAHYGSREIMLSSQLLCKAAPLQDIP